MPGASVARARVSRRTSRVAGLVADRRPIVEPRERNHLVAAERARCLHVEFEPASTCCARTAVEREADLADDAVRARSSVGHAFQLAYARPGHPGRRRPAGSRRESVGGQTGDLPVQRRERRAHGARCRGRAPSWALLTTKTVLTHGGHVLRVSEVEFGARVRERPRLARRQGHRGALLGPAACTASGLVPLKPVIWTCSCRACRPTTTVTASSSVLRSVATPSTGRFASAGRRASAARVRRSRRQLGAVVVERLPVERHGAGLLVAEHLARAARRRPGRRRLADG